MDSVIGLLIKKPQSIFSNGCVQQSYFLYKLLLKTGYDVKLMTMEQNYSTFEINDVPIVKLNIMDDLSNLRALIFTSATVNNKPWLDKLDLHGVKIINLICGNLYILHQEQHVFGKHNIIKDSLNSGIDENWLLPMYDYARSYINFLTKKPVHITPYVWDTDLIRAYVEKNSLGALGNFSKNRRNCMRINFLIFEPNMSIHKTSHIPLLIAENYHVRNPGVVNKVFHFCSDTVRGLSSNSDGSHSMSTSNIESLNIYKEHMIESNPRVIMPHILNQIEIVSGNQKCLNIVLSHNIKNELNFLHLELFYLGYPIVHNCTPYKGNLLYYNDSDLDCAIAKINKARELYSLPPNKILDYQRELKKIIDLFSPNKKESIAKYKKQLDATCVERDIDRKHFRIKDAFLSELTFTGDFYERDAKCIVLCISKPNHITQCIAFLKSLYTTPNKIAIEVYYSVGSNVLTTQIQEEIRSLFSGCDDIDVEGVSHIQFINIFSEENIHVPENFKEKWDPANHVDRPLPAKLLKLLAMANSKYRYVMMCDSSVVLCQNPILYFNSQQFIDVGNVFWSHLWKYDTRSADNLITTWCLSKYYGHPIPTHDSTVDASVFLFDKHKCKGVIELLLRICDEYEYFERFVTENDDIFKFVFKVLGKRMFIISQHPGIVGNQFVEQFLGHGIVQQIKEHVVAFFNFDCVPFNTRNLDMSYELILWPTSSNKKIGRKIIHDVISYTAPSLEENIQCSRIPGEMKNMFKGINDVLKNVAQKDCFHHVISHIDTSVDVGEFITH